MAIKIKNTTGSDFVLLGQLIEASSDYTLQTGEPARYGSDDATLVKIASGDAVINDGVSDLGVAAGISLLTGAGTKLAKIEEETQFTQGNQYQTKGFCASIPASIGWHNVDWSFPYAISIYSAEFVDSPVKAGDRCQFEIGPETIIGALGANASASATTFTLSAGAIAYLNPGRYITLDDGTNKDFCGQITSMDIPNDQITCATATTNAFSAATPTYVKLTSRMVDDWYFEGVAAAITLGEGVIGGSYISANTTLRLRYYNSDGVAKVFNFAIEGKY